MEYGGSIRGGEKVDLKRTWCGKDEAWGSLTGEMVTDYCPFYLPEKERRCLVSLFSRVRNLDIEQSRDILQSPFTSRYPITQSFMLLS